LLLPGASVTGLRADADAASHEGSERTFYFLTYAFQGSSYLVPSAYAYTHRAHHAYSDTDKDPHTPPRFSNPFAMMLDTKHTCHAWVHGRAPPEPRLRGYVPTCIANCLGGRMRSTGTGADEETEAFPPLQPTIAEPTAAL
jgi:hypothetical protein